MNFLSLSRWQWVLAILGAVLCLFAPAFTFSLLSNVSEIANQLATGLFTGFMVELARWYFLALIESKGVRLLGGPSRGLLWRFCEAVPVVTVIVGGGILFVVTTFFAAAPPWPFIISMFFGGFVVSHGLAPVMDVARKAGL